MPILIIPSLQEVPLIYKTLNDCVCDRRIRTFRHRSILRNKSLFLLLKEKMNNGSMVTSAGILDGYCATKILFSKFYLIRQLEILVCSILKSGKGTYGGIRFLQ
uniref:Uncharacterized protein n=1 Tax=Micrurus paraensis TaxID=1970185 RepID=A0A2D4L1U6_9SAUR